jgi:hypothetical protein
MIPGREFRRNQLIAACFPVGSIGGSLLIVDLNHANHGLASPSWREKAPYLRNLHAAMLTWRGHQLALSAFPTTDGLYLNTERNVHELEEVVARFYTQSFYDHFHRAPSLPRRVSHQAL